MTQATLDHVAIGAWSRDEVAADFGRWCGGREVARFAITSWAGLQLQFAAGIRLEILEPVDNPADDFLQRFLERSGPSPHHATFKVKDIRGALKELAERGIEPVKVDLSNPGWQEAFLHPALGLGTVVQLAQQGGPWSAEHELQAASPGILRTTFLGAELAANAASAATVFGEVLGARASEVGDGRTAYAWEDGTLVVTPLEEGGRPRVLALVFRQDDRGDGPEIAPGQELLYGGPAHLVRLGPGEKWPS